MQSVQGLRFLQIHAHGHGKFSLVPKLGRDSVNIAVRIHKAAVGQVVRERNWRQGYQAVVATRAWHTEGLDEGPRQASRRKISVEEICKGNVHKV